MVSKITNPPSQVDLVDKVNEIIDDKQDKLDVAQLSYYGTCTTASSSQNKVVSCSGFVLKTGVSIRVRFTSGQGYNGTPTLNVNSTGAINIMSIGTTSALRYSWQAGEIVSFTYDGTNWLMEDAGTATATYYGYTKLTTSATSPSVSTALSPNSLNQLVLNMIEPYPAFSTSSTYQVGDRVRRNYNAWECIDDITEAGAWDDAQWIALDPIQDQIDAKQATLVSGTNIKTINNTSLLGSGNIDISGGSVLVDDVTISRDSNQKLQAIGVINSRDSSTAIKTWTGTKAQYEAIVSKDANTLYNITDDSDVSLTILEALYPVGSVYITTANTCPLSTLISGSTWELVSSGRVLQGADSSHAAGTTIEAGLPNISGNVRAETTGALGVFMTGDTNGVFEVVNPDSSKMQQGTANNNYTSSNKVNFDASRSSSIYGNSSTVQPPAYVVNIFRRTA